MQLSKMIQGDGEIRRLVCIIYLKKDEFCGIIKYKLVKKIYIILSIYLKKIFFCDIINISKCFLA